MTSYPARYAVVAVCLAALLIEGGARLSRAAEIPLFVKDPSIGYYVAPNQSGAVFWRNDWTFNDRGMGTHRAFAPAETDILLVGDSVVMGGNRTRQSERLGPMMEAEMAVPVWPVAAGGWSIRNELAYLAANPDIAPRLKQIVFVLNTQDFRDGIVWEAERTRPTKRPWSHALFLANRHFRKAAVRRTTSPGSWQDDLTQFAAQHPDQQITFVLFPTRQESASVADREKLDVAAKELANLVPDADLVHVVADPRWNPELYEDAIHPSAGGNALLADIVSKALGGSAGSSIP